MRTVAIIQARMGSTRLPGKVLSPLVGKPVLWHIVHRLHRCRTVDAIAVATSDKKSDDAIEAFALKEGVQIVRGPEDNVLARYALAAEKLNPDIIVRITGDAPLIDPVTIDRLVEKIIQDNLDFCVGDPELPSIHEGFDPFSNRALRKLMDEATDDPVAREHVTAYFKEHPEFVRIGYLAPEPSCLFSGARISVDTPADLHFLEEIYSRLDVPAGEADIRDVVGLLRSEPELIMINTHIYQKKPSERSLKVLFRCDGDTELGLGHVYRCLALAEEFREGQGCGVVFAMERGLQGFELVRQAGYLTELKPDDETEGIWLRRVVGNLEPDVVVLDLRTDLEAGNIDQWRARGVLVITIDDPSDRRLACDLAFFSPTPQLEEVDWSGSTCEVLAGWDWVLLRREFGRRHEPVKNSPPMVLVTMGGSDPEGMTLKATKALESLKEDFRTVVVLGPAFNHHEAFQRFLSGAGRSFEVRENVDDMSTLMAEADLALASFGQTAYELAAMGLPAIYLCLTRDHEASAQAFVRAGVAKSLGWHRSVTAAGVAQSVRSLLDKHELRRRMAESTVDLVDGRGAAMIAKRVVAEVRQRDG